MPQVFKNAARATLAAAIAAADTSLVVSAALADLFPVANTGVAAVGGTTDWFKVVLQDASGNIEIVYVRTRNFGSGLMSNLIRGREGTTARDFPVGSVVGLRLTAEDVSNSVNTLSNANTWSATQTFSGTAQFNGVANFAQVANFAEVATFSKPIVGSITGNAATVTNGLVSTGSYSNPDWLTSLASNKVTGNLTNTVNGVTVGTNARGARTVSTAGPSGGADGDIWYRV